MSVLAAQFSRVRRSTTWHVGVKVNYLGSGRVRFVCPAGHPTVVDYRRRGISIAALERRFVPAWQARVTHECFRGSCRSGETDGR